MFKLLVLFKNQYFWLLILLAFGLFVRLYKIDTPIADWHSWRQVDTAAVTRNFIKEGFNPLKPRGDDMSIVSEVNIPNLNRLRFVEFPIYNMTVYPLYLLFGVNEMYHRLVSILYSLGSIVFLFFLVRKYHGILIALISTFIFAFLPFNIFFSRTTLPEPTLIFFCLGMMYFISHWIDSGRKSNFIFGAVFGIISFLIKPWSVFFFLPLVFQAMKKERKVLLPIKYLLLTFIILLPFLIWRLWMLQSPEGIPASSWLTNGDGIRFRPAFWWWIISERISREILGVTGVFLFFLALIIKPKNNNYFFHIWTLSMFLYIIVFATGNVRHDYYQLIFTPVASIFISLGFVYLIKGEANFIPRLWTIILAFLFLPLIFYFTWNHVKGLYQVNNPIVIEAGRRADQVLPKNAVVVAPYNGDTAFLYHINRSGWPVVSLPLKELITNYGVSFYVSVANDDKTNWVKRHFEIIEESPNFVIADLTKLTKEFDESDPEPD